MANILESNDYIMPGEYEPQSAIWLGWPTFQRFHDPALDTRQTIATIAKVLSEHEVASYIMCGDAVGISQAQEWMKANGFPISPNMHFVAIDQVDIWVRDYGPIFLLNRASGKLAIASYMQNQWGYSTETDPVSVRMSQLPKAVLDYLELDTLLATDVVSEGGDRIQNGQGTLLVNRAVELQRNPATSTEELDAAYKYTLGATKVIWLNAGAHEDLHADWGPIPYTDPSGKQVLLYGPETTGGHLDELCRFVSPNCVLLAQVTEQEAATDPVAAVNYARLADAYRVLCKSTDQDGRPFEILRIPVPTTDFRSIDSSEPMYYNFLEKLSYSGDAPPFPKGDPVYIVRSSSYANYLVTNGLIIAPKYGDDQRDSEAHAALSSAYLDREVVQIDPTPLNYAGGGIHCVTQQQPRAGAES